MVSIMLYPCIFCIALLMDQFCLLGFVNSLVNQFAICLCVVFILLLIIMEVLSVG